MFKSNHFKLKNEIIHFDPARQIDRQELHTSFKAGKIKMYVRNVNDLVPTGQRAIGADLLFPVENRHFSDQEPVKVTINCWLNNCLSIN